MELRRNVKVEGIPITWDTNLSDGEVRELYFLLAPDLRTGCNETEVSDKHSAQFGVFQKAIDFKDGLVFCQGLSICDGPVDHLIAVYRTHEEWRVWESHHSEVEELREEQWRSREADSLMFDVQDRDLREKIDDAILARRYDDALKLFRLREELRARYEHLRLRVGRKWGLFNDGMRMFVHFPSSDPGIEFVKAGAKFFYSFVRFANAYIARTPSTGILRISETDKIFRTALTIYPGDGLLYARACLFWRKRKVYHLAIEYCELAIKRRVHDGTKSGFDGRLARLRKEVESKKGQH